MLILDPLVKLPNLSAASIRMQSLESEFSSGKDLFEKDNKPRSVLAIKNRLQADFDSKLINVANLFLRYKTSIQPFATEILNFRCNDFNSRQIYRIYLF